MTDSSFEQRVPAAEGAGMIELESRARGGPTRTKKPSARDVLRVLQKMGAPATPSEVAGEMPGDIDPAEVSRILVKVFKETGEGEGSLLRGKRGRAFEYVLDGPIPTLAEQTSKNSKGAAMTRKAAESKSRRVAMKEVGQSGSGVEESPSVSILDAQDATVKGATMEPTGREIKAVVTQEVPETGANRRGNRKKRATASHAGERPPVDMVAPKENEFPAAASSDEKYGDLAKLPAVAQPEKNQEQRDVERQTAGAADVKGNTQPEAMKADAAVRVAEHSKPAPKATQTRTKRARNAPTVVQNVRPEKEEGSVAITTHGNRQDAAVAAGAMSNTPIADSGEASPRSRQRLEQRKFGKTSKDNKSITSEIVLSATDSRQAAPHEQQRTSKPRRPEAAASGAGTTTSNRTAADKSSGQMTVDIRLTDQSVEQADADQKANRRAKAQAAGQQDLAAAARLPVESPAASIAWPAAARLPVQLETASEFDVSIGRPGSVALLAKIDGDGQLTLKRGKTQLKISRFELAALLGYVDAAHNGKD